MRVLIIIMEICKSRVRLFRSSCVMTRITDQGILSTVAIPMHRCTVDYLFTTAGKGVATAFAGMGHQLQPNHSNSNSKLTATLEVGGERG